VAGEAVRQGRDAFEDDDREDPVGVLLILGEGTAGDDAVEPVALLSLRHAAYAWLKERL
jgi:hypothetical protein